MEDVELCLKESGAGAQPDPLKRKLILMDPTPLRQLSRTQAAFALVATGGYPLWDFGGHS